MRESVTALVTTLDEERNIHDCLASVAWADEILLVDSGSTDDTLKIAERFNPRVLEHEYENAAAQKNWADWDTHNRHMSRHFSPGMAFLLGSHKRGRSFSRSAEICLDRS